MEQKRLTLSEYDAIVAFDRLCFPQDHWTEEDWRELLADERAVYLALLDDGRIVGDVFVYNWQGERDYGKISFAMASGGSDLKPKAAASALPFGGGAGCGVKIVPVAFLVLQGERVRMLPITEPATSTADRLIEQIPELVDRINEMISQYRAEKKVDVDLA